MRFRMLWHVIRGRPLAWRNPADHTWTFSGPDSSTVTLDDKVVQALPLRGAAARWRELETKRTGGLPEKETREDTLQQKY
jgi:hypothetical protein